jgi:cytidine deaminase
MDPLIQAALAARGRARAPYSNFQVGAAVSDEHGHVYAGCNIESASYGLSICAERVAVFKALSESGGKLIRIAVVADTETLTPPCGACRQILWEFCRDAELLLANPAGRQETTTVRQIFPRPFDASFL